MLPDKKGSASRQLEAQLAEGLKRSTNLGSAHPSLSILEFLDKVFERNTKVCSVKRGTHPQAKFGAPGLTTRSILTTSDKKLLGAPVYNSPPTAAIPASPTSCSAVTYLRASRSVFLAARCSVQSAARSTWTSRGETKEGHKMGR